MDQPKSLSNFFSNLRPRNRPERGGTLRPAPNTVDSAKRNPSPKHHTTTAAPSSDKKPTPPPRRRPSQNHHNNVPPPSPPPTHDKNHAARHALRKSGDFLGVTGVNPRTGLMDVLTPTTGSSEDVTAWGDPRLARLARRAQEAREEYEAARGEVKKEGVRRVLMEGGVRWRKDGDGGWVGAEMGTGVSRGDGAVSFLGRGGAATTVALDCRRVGRRVVGGGAMAELSLRTRAFQLRFPSLIPTRKRSRGKGVVARDGGSQCPGLMRMDGPVTRLRLEKQVTAERWAETVNRDLDGVDSGSPGKGFNHRELVRLTPGTEEARRRSAFTSITTTTGCAFSPMPCPPRPGCGAKADTLDRPMPESADSAALVMTRTHRSSSGSLERTDSWICLDRAASPLAARPNSWPSTAGGRVSYPTTLQVVVDGRVVATIEPVSNKVASSPGPPSDTISVLDETATSDSGASPHQEQDPPRLRGGNQRHKEMRKTMRRPAVDESSVGERSSSRSSTPTSGRPRWWTTAARSELLCRKPAPGPRGGLDTALMAREAARTAYCSGSRGPIASPGASSGTVAVVVGHGGAPLPQPAPATPDKKDEHPPPPASAAVEGDTGGPSSTSPPAVEPAPAPGSEWGQPGDSPIVALQAVLTVVVQVGAAYWRLVKPVFVAESAVRQRFEQGKSTWDDFALYVLAMVFLLIGVLAGVWMYRGLVGSVRLVGVVGKACLVLAGI